MAVGCSKQAAPPEPVRAVKLLEIGAVSSVRQVEYAGAVQARTELMLGFQVAGRLQQRWVNVGDVVRKGQLLAQLDGQDYALAAQAAQAQVVAATTQRDLAQADWQRFSALHAEGFISGVELDRRRASVQAAQAQLEQAQAQAAAQNNQSNYTRLWAGADGVVTAVGAESGQVLSAGAMVVRLAHEGERDVVIAVPEDARSGFPLGLDVQVQAWHGQQAWGGVVREVAASADPVTRTYAVKVAMQGGDQPSLGATARVLVALQEPVLGSPAMLLPSTALHQQGQGSAVWVFEPETSRLRAQTVQVAGVQGNEVLIAHGLAPGMLVVATGTHVLTQGQKVSVYSSASAQPVQ